MHIGLINLSSDCLVATTLKITPIDIEGVEWNKSGKRSANYMHILVLFVFLNIATIWGSQLHTEMLQVLCSWEVSPK